MRLMSGSAFGPLAVIADPAAGEGRVADGLISLRRELDASELEHTLWIAEGAGEATRRTQAALDEGYRYVVAVGGDRTVQEVVNGLFRDGVAIVDDPVLGIVAAHSGCDLVRSFGLPGDVVSAARHLVGESTYPLDIVKIVSTGPDGEPIVRYSHNLAEVGLGAAAARRATGLPAWVGRARRFVGFWLAFAQTRMTQVRIDADRRIYEGPAFNVVVANAQFSGGGMRLSPRSFPGDGVLDTLVFHGPRSDAYTMLPRIYRHGDHVPDPHIHEMHARVRVAVEAERPLPIVADGEPVGTTPATFQILPGKVLLKL
jgi:YegS/Rv2252/BmrU family lipid kinase